MLPGTTILEFRTLKKTARFGAKVRTGCRTCKTRRVKCDEQRPNCTRCVSSGRKCGGYTQEVDLVTLKAVSPRQSPTSALSDLGENVVYLEFYQHCAGVSIASNFDRDFWSRIVLQLSQSEPAVRHAVTALGYLIKTEPGSLKHARSFSTMESRKTLLVQYNKAVRSLVERMSESSYSIEIGLVTCLLFICIECLRGDYPAAFTHLHSGLKVIAQTGPSSPSSLASSVADPGMIANKLAPIFNRAITIGLLFGAPFEPILDSHCLRPLLSQRPSFRNLFEAQTELHELRNATIILISVLYRKTFGGILVDSDDIRYRLHLLNCHDHWLRGLQGLESEGNLSTEDIIVSSSLKVSHYCTYIALAGALDLEQIVFDSHLENVKALNYHAKIVLDSTGLPEPPVDVSGTPQSVSSLSDASETSVEPFIGAKSPAAHFTFDISVIVFLYFAATRCRCPITRRESLSLLERNPPRESLWDAEQHALVVKRTIELEEREVDPISGWPVQKTRLGPTIIGDIDENGRFCVGFRSIAWMLGSKYPTGSMEARPEVEWEEWFQI